MKELVTKKTGRPPKKKTVEKRVEQLLAGKQEPEKPRIGRPPKTYEERPDHIKYIIDCSAVGCSPTAILNLLKERYGDSTEVVSVSTIKSYIKRYGVEILQREKELRTELHLLNPVMRIRYLQRIVDEAFEGQEMYDRMGNFVGTKKDYSVIVSAIKEMNAMQKEIDAQKPVNDTEARVQREMEEQKRLIDEYVTSLSREKGISKLEALQSITKDFQEHADVIELLTSDYKM